jgi:hypothetical protein
MLRAHQYEAEYDAAMWIDNHNLLRRFALLLAHHRVLRAVALVLASPALTVAATCWAVRESGRVIDRTHEVAGEDSRLCPPCVNREAKILTRTDEFTVEDFIGLCDLGELK